LLDYLLTTVAHIENSALLDSLVVLADKCHLRGLRIAVCGDEAAALITAKPLRTPELFIFGKDEVNEEDVLNAHSELLKDLSRIDCIIAGPVLEARTENRICTSDDLDNWLRQKALTVESFAILIDPDNKHTVHDPCTCLATTMDGTLGINPELNIAFEVSPTYAPLLAARFSLVADDILCQELEKDTSSWTTLSDEDRGQFLLDILGENDPSAALILLHQTNLLHGVFPLLDEMAGVDEKTVKADSGKKRFQHKDVFYHTMQVVRNVTEKSQNIWLRMAALLHDVAKPRTKAFSPGNGWTFHGHAEIGSRMVKHLFQELKLDKEHRSYVRRLVALHLRPMALVSEGVTDSAVRRLITDAGEDLEDLLTLCRCDITSKNPGKVTRYLSNYDRLVESILEVVEKDRLREWQPPISGQEIMDTCGIPAGVMVGILKTHIEAAILDGKIANENSAAISYLLEIKDELLAQGDSRKPMSKKQTLNSLPKHLRK
jgi:poly(A) polymerase